MNAATTAAEAVDRLRADAEQLRVQAEEEGDTPRGGALRARMLQLTGAALLVEEVCR